MTLSVIPLFQEIGQEISCRLLSSQGYPSGLVQLRYEIIYFKIVEYGSDAYKQAVALREEILRKPFGLSFTPEELACEKDHIHITGYLGQELCTTAVLAPEVSTLKMQRVATKTSFQNKGAGSVLMRFCEQYAKEHGYTTIYCHARATAIPFYLKHQYILEDEPFEEDGIPHHKMRKTLK